MPAEERLFVSSRRHLLSLVAVAAGTATAAPCLAATTPTDRGEQFEQWERERDRLFSLSAAALTDEEADPPFNAAWRMQNLLLDTPCTSRREACAKLRAAFHDEVGMQHWAEPTHEAQAIRQVLAFLEAN